MKAAVILRLRTRLLSVLHVLNLKVVLGASADYRETR